MYWFIRLYEYNTDGEDFSLYGGYKKRSLIDETVLESPSRDEAKAKAKELFGDYPFRLTKNNKINGQKYFYLCKSNKRWYDYHNKELEIVCDNCKKYKKVKGEKNIWSKYYTLPQNENNSENDYSIAYFCSFECKSKFEKMLEEEKTKNWVFRDTHLLVGGMKTLNKLVGYIYKITNKNTGLSYIGQTKDSPVFRWYAHLKEDDNKFQRNNICDLCFEVLEVVCKPNSLSEREQYFINLYDTIEHGYNKRNEVKTRSTE
ncbi:MAG: GIY-YIG nuclease family protein [bacterium]